MRTPVDIDKIRSRPLREKILSARQTPAFRFLGLLLGLILSCQYQKHLKLCFYKEGKLHRPSRALYNGLVVFRLKKSAVWHFRLVIAMLKIFGKRG